MDCLVSELSRIQIVRGETTYLHCWHQFSSLTSWVNSLSLAQIGSGTLSRHRHGFTVKLKRRELVQQKISCRWWLGYRVSYLTIKMKSKPVFSKMSASIRSHILRRSLNSIPFHSSSGSILLRIAGTSNPHLKTCYQGKWQHCCFTV